MVGREMGDPAAAQSVAEPEGALQVEVAAELAAVSAEKEALPAMRGRTAAKDARRLPVLRVAASATPARVERR